MKNWTCGQQASQLLSLPMVNKLFTELIVLKFTSILKGKPPHNNKQYEYIAKRRTKGEPPFLQKFDKESKGEVDKL